MNEFNEKYFNSVNYADYLERGDRYDRLADEIMTHLKTHKLDRGPILDFGCAVGLLLDSLKKLEYTDIYGVDISEWALSVVKDKGHTAYTKADQSTVHGVTFALDVLEHMPENEMSNFIANLQTRVLVFRMPIRKEEDDDYFLECSRADPTHVICWSRPQWKTFFEENDYIPLDIDLHTIYNSEGVYTGIAISKSLASIEF